MISTQSAFDLISRLNLVDESEDLEAKTLAGSEVGRSVYETICSLSNEPGLGGGTILLGVSKEESLFPLYAATGVSDPDKISGDIASACGTIFNLPVRVDVHPEIIGKAVVLRVNVHELPKGQKPVYFKAAGLPKGAFRRVGPTDVRCTDEDLSAFFQGKADSPSDTNIVKDAVWDGAVAICVEISLRRSPAD